MLVKHVWASTCTFDTNKDSQPMSVVAENWKGQDFHDEETDKMLAGFQTEWVNRLSIIIYQSSEFPIIKTIILELMQI